MSKPDDVVWCDTLLHLRINHPDMCRQWFDDLTPQRLSGGIFEVAIDNPIRRRYLERECQELFNTAAQAVTQRLISVRFVEVKTPNRANGYRAADKNGHTKGSASRGTALGSELTSARSDGHTNGIDSGSARTTGKNGVHSGNGARQTRRSVRDGGEADHLAILPDYTFGTFVTGPENEYAQAAAQGVTVKPGNLYNPLFIYGGVGLGKTHLLQAICLETLELRPDAKVAYLLCHDFNSQCISATKSGNGDAFRARFRSVDLLVIDDIQFLEQWASVQEELFHTFNHLFQGKKQIVFSCDKKPSEVPSLEERLVSRFGSGLVVEVLPPTYDTRVQIIKQKAAIRGLELADEVACEIASRTARSVRQLDGDLSTLLVRSQVERRPIDLALVHEALGPSEMPAAPSAITTARIVNVVTSYYDVTNEQLVSKSRQQSITRPRQICMFLTREKTDHSLQEVGRQFGGRDHTTVMHAVKTIKQRIMDNSEFAQVIAELKRRLTEPM